jgi:hypothetical protein
LIEIAVADLAVKILGVPAHTLSRSTDRADRSFTNLDVDGMIEPLNRSR